MARCLLRIYPSAHLAARLVLRALHVDRAVLAEDVSHAEIAEHGRAHERRDGAVHQAQQDGQRVGVGLQDEALRRTDRRVARCQGGASPRRNRLTQDREANSAGARDKRSEEQRSRCCWESGYRCPMRFRQPAVSQTMTVCLLLAPAVPDCPPGHPFAACMSVFHPVCLSVRPPVRPSVCLSVCRSARLSICWRPARPSVRPSVHPSVDLPSVRLPVSVPVLQSLTLVPYAAHCSCHNRALERSVPAKQPLTQ
jgi:hypothetical protein